jgi:hypothetical protein
MPQDNNRLRAYFMLQAVLRIGSTSFIIFHSIVNFGRPLQPEDSFQQMMPS